MIGYISICSLEELMVILTISVTFSLLGLVCYGVWKDEQKKNR